MKGDSGASKQGCSHQGPKSRIQDRTFGTMNQAYQHCCPFDSLGDMLRAKGACLVVYKAFGMLSKEEHKLVDPRMFSLETQIHFSLIALWGCPSTYTTSRPVLLTNTSRSSKPISPIRMRAALHANSPSRYCGL